MGLETQPREQPLQSPRTEVKKRAGKQLDMLRVKIGKPASQKQWLSSGCSLVSYWFGGSCVICPRDRMTLSVPRMDSASTYAASVFVLDYLCLCENPPWIPPNTA